MSNKSDEKKSNKTKRADISRDNKGKKVLFERKSQHQTTSRSQNEKSEQNSKTNVVDSIPVEDKVAEVYDEIQFDQQFKDRLAGRLENVINDYKAKPDPNIQDQSLSIRSGNQSYRSDQDQSADHDGGDLDQKADNLPNMEDYANENCPNKSIEPNPPFFLFPLFGAFALVIWGFIILYENYTAEPEISPADQGNSNQEQIKKVMPEQMHFDLVSQSIFQEDINTCYLNCSAAKMYEEAFKTSVEIHSYKIEYNQTTSDNNDKFVRGFQNFQQKGRYLYSNKSIDGPHTLEEIIFEDWKLVRKFDSSGNWISNENVEGSFDVEPFGFQKALGFLSEDDSHVQKYELEELENTKQLVIMGEGSMQEDNRKYDFTVELEILPNLYIKDVKVTKELDEDIIEIQNYHYFDFERNYVIYNPKNLSFGIFDRNTTAESLYNYIAETTTTQRGGSYMVIYKSDKNDELDYVKGLEYTPLGNSQEIHFPYAQYVSSLADGKKQEVYIDNTRYVREYTQSSNKWTDWEEDQTANHWDINEIRRFHPAVIMDKYSESTNWNIVKYNVEDGLSKYQKVVVLQLEGVAKHTNKLATLKISFTALNTISRIEVEVKEDNKYVYSSSYDYFKFGDKFIDEMNDPSGKLQKAYEEAYPDPNDDAYLLNQLDDNGKLNCSSQILKLTSKIPGDWSCNVQHSDNSVMATVIMKESVDENYSITITNRNRSALCKTGSQGDAHSCTQKQYYSNDDFTLYQIFDEGELVAIYGIIGEGQEGRDISLEVDLRHVDDDFLMQDKETVLFDIFDSISLEK